MFLLVYVHPIEIIDRAEESSPQHNQEYNLRFKRRRQPRTPHLHHLGWYGSGHRQHTK